MQLTIEIKESALDKIIYLLSNLKDIKIIKTTSLDSALEIETIPQDSHDFKSILEGRQERKTNPQNYGTMDDIRW